jgi:low temperature requirement protein LtrA
MSKQNYNIWWGAPKKFSTDIVERKISWLELFYDLVYVIVIAKITHYLAEHPSVSGLLDYCYLFTMTFWGWYNGSMHHDVHGSPGIRTRFMTLWQMMAVGVLAISLESPSESILNYTTIAIMFLQLFITYLWWSVGIYDKQHRKFNVPYTFWFLAAFVLLIITFWTPFPYKRIIFWVALVINYLPFALTARRLKKEGIEYTLSSNMTERLGLFTIIIFGEAILGVINGVSHLHHLDIYIWLCFGLGILIVFALWWIFFSSIADRECKKGMWAGNAISLLYLPTLASLGMVGAAFPALMENISTKETHFSNPLQIVFGTSIALFLWCVTAISCFLLYPPEYGKSKKLIQRFLILTGVINLLLMFLFPVLSIFFYLLCVFVSLMIVIVIITHNWSRIDLNRSSQVDE